MSATPPSSSLRSRKSESAGKTKKSPKFIENSDEESNVPLVKKNSGQNSGLNLGRSPKKSGEISEIDHDFYKPTEIHRPFDWRHWTLFFIFVAVSYSFTSWCDARLPDPVTLDEAKPGEFVEERARNFLIELTSFGPRPSGKNFFISVFQ